MLNSYRALVLGLLGTMAFVLSGVGSGTETSGPSQAKQDDAQKTFEKLKQGYIDLAKRNREMEDFIDKLCRDHEQVFAKHDERMKGLSADIAKGQKDATDQVAGLKDFIDRQQYRIEWKSIEAGVNAEERKRLAVKFSGPVIEATAQIYHLNYDHGRDNHRQVLKLFGEARLAETKGDEVYVDVQAFTHDHDGHRAQCGIGIIVLARIKGFAAK